MKSYSNQTLDVIFNHLAQGYERLRQEHLKEPCYKRRGEIDDRMMRTLSVMNEITGITAERVLLKLETFKIRYQNAVS